MVLRNSKHPAGMLKHVGVADVLVYLAKPQKIENVGGDDGCRVTLNCWEEAWFLPGSF
jgi:hypothetical protein